MEVTVDLSQYERQMARLKFRRPMVFDRMFQSFLHEGAAKIKRESIVIAKREAKGVGSGYGSYFSSFHISSLIKGMTSANADVSRGKVNAHSDIRETSSPTWAIKIYNTAKHSVIVEYGAIWKKSPPPAKALKKWVQVKLGIKDVDEVDRVAEAIAWGYFAKGKSRKRGQVYFNKTNPEPGRVLVMNRAAEKSAPQLVLIFGKHLEKALKAI